MRQLIQQNYQNQTESSQCCDWLCCSGVCDAGAEFSFEEIVHSTSSQMGSSAALTSGRISRTQRLSTWNTDSSQFALVNSSGVVATRSRGCDCIDDRVINLDGHAVASFDCFNLMPTNSDLTQHIRNRDTFIVENDFRLQEQNIGSQNNRDTDCCNCDDSVPAIDNHIVEQKTYGEHEAKGEIHKVTSRAIDVRVTHSRIMTHQSHQGSKEALA